MLDRETWEGILILPQHYHRQYRLRASYLTDMTFTKTRVPEEVIQLQIKKQLLYYLADLSEFEFNKVPDYDYLG